MSLKITNQATILRPQQWETSGEGESFQILPVKDTWHDPRKDSNCPTGVLAVFLCPKCSTTTAALKQYSQITSLGKLTPEFRCMKCGVILELYFDRYHDNKPLYALALIHLKKQEIELRYTHANNQVEASRGINLATHSVVGIGPAIGYKVQDSQGKILSVD